MKWLWRAVVAVAVLGLLGYGLGIIPGPLRDLALVGAGVVERVGPPMESDDAPPAEGPYLLVTVSSRQNLIRKGQRSELNIFATIVDCANRDASIFAYGPFYRGLYVSDVGPDADKPRFASYAKQQAGRYDYQIFIPLTGRLRSESDFNRPMPSYDLRRERRTLCIRIGGGNMMAGHFSSNEIRFAPPYRPITQ